MAGGVFRCGSGTPADPYMVEDLKDLEEIHNGFQTPGKYYYNKYFVLITNIDLDEEGETTLEEPLYYFHPIGNYGDSNITFEGGFDGNGHVIKNGRFKTGGFIGGNAGLFASIGGGGLGEGDGCLIKNVFFDNVELYAYNSGVGYIAGAALNATVRNCHVINGNLTNTYTDNGRAGGLVGHSADALHLEECSYRGSINGRIVGGLVGSMTNTEYLFGNFITDCFARGDLTGYLVGGMVGSITTAYHSIRYCYSACSFTAGAAWGSGHRLGGYGGIWHQNASITMLSLYYDNTYIGHAYYDAWSYVVGNGRITEDMTYPHDTETTYINFDFYLTWEKEEFWENNAYPFIKRRYYPNLICSPGFNIWVNKSKKWKQITTVHCNKAKKMKGIGTIDVNKGKQWRPI